MTEPEEHVDIDEKTIKTEIKPSKSGAVLFPNENKYSHIKNKLVRSQQYQKVKREQKKVRIFVVTL